MKRQFKQAVCKGLAVAVLLMCGAGVPVAASESESLPPEEPVAVDTQPTGAITAFAAPDGITLPVGTPQEELSMPAELAATAAVEGENGPAEQAVSLPVEGWACTAPETGYDSAAPGSYTFAPTLGALPYPLAEGVQPPTVVVTLEAAPVESAPPSAAPPAAGAPDAAVAPMAAGGDFTVTLTNGGGDPDPSTDYEYAPGVLTIKSATPMTIANTDPATSTTDSIVVQSGVTANLTLAGVNIDVSMGYPFNMRGATVRLTLQNDNILSGSNAALFVPEGSSITITDSSTGTLTASGVQGAGIGGNDGSKGGTISIDGGTVNAMSLEGAGIGGGVRVGPGGNGGTVTITGGTVTASSVRGAGIGGGFGSVDGGVGGTIIITGGTVHSSSETGAAIGGGHGAFQGGVGGTVQISGAGTVVTAVSTDAAKPGYDVAADMARLAQAPAAA